MARLRLFANLRELAGKSEVDIGGDTVGAVLDAAVSRYGDEFGKGLGYARVWLNGRPAQPEDPVTEADEVAAIPPVSGGADTTIAVTARAIEAALIVAVLLVANALDEPGWFVASLVGVGAWWAWDITSDAAGIRLRPFRLPVLASVLAGGLVTYGFEVAELEPGVAGIGLGVALGFSVVVSLAGSLLSPRHRDLVSVAATATISAVAALAVGSLVLVRIETTAGQTYVWIFLSMVIIGKVVESLLARYGPLPALDPLSGAVLATVLAGVGAAFVWEVNPYGLFLVSVLVAISLIAGSALGSLLRVGEATLAGRLPGALPTLDGPAVAALVYAPFIALLL